MLFIQICVELKVYNEKILIYQKCDNAGYLSCFTNSIIRDSEHNWNKRQDQKDEYIILPSIFEIGEESILLEFPYCQQNELIAKRFLAKFHQFTNQKFQVFLKRHTLAKKNLECWNSVEWAWGYTQGIWTCKTCKGESEPQQFKWETLLQSPKDNQLWANFETSFIAAVGLTLNNQLDMKRLYLFYNGAIGKFFNLV